MVILVYSTTKVLNSIISNANCISYASTNATTGCNLYFSRTNYNNLILSCITNGQNI